MFVKVLTKVRAKSSFLTSLRAMGEFWVSERADGRDPTGFCVCGMAANSSRWIEIDTGDGDGQECIMLVPGHHILDKL
jgi:hypothetical protein